MYIHYISDHTHIDLLIPSTPITRNTVHVSYWLEAVPSIDAREIFSQGWQFGNRRGDGMSVPPRRCNLPKICVFILLPAPGPFLMRRFFFVHVCAGSGLRYVGTVQYRAPCSGKPAGARRAGGEQTIQIKANQIHFFFLQATQIIQNLHVPRKHTQRSISSTCRG